MPPYSLRYPQTQVQGLSALTGLGASTALAGTNLPLVLPLVLALVLALTTAAPMVLLTMRLVRLHILAFTFCECFVLCMCECGILFVCWLDEERKEERTCCALRLISRCAQGRVNAAALGVWRWCEMRRLWW